MRDHKGKMFYWSVSRSGRQAVRPNKALYGQMFALSALAYYYRTFEYPLANTDLGLTLLHGIGQVVAQQHHWLVDTTRYPVIGSMIAGYWLNDCRVQPK